MCIISDARVCGMSSKKKSKKDKKDKKEKKEKKRKEREKEREKAKRKAASLPVPQGVDGVSAEMVKAAHAVRNLIFNFDSMLTHSYMRTGVAWC